MLYASNIPIFDYLGISAMHSIGVTGKGINICSRESNTSKHGRKVFDIIQQIVPDANIIIKQHYYDLKQHVDIYTTSLFNKDDTKEINKNIAKDLYAKDTFLVCAVGNEEYESCTSLSKEDVWTSIGACNYKDGKVKRLSYSSITDNIDFMSITNLETSLGTFTGSSCSAPVFASMCALVQSYYLQVSGKKLTNAELLEFIKVNCIDLDKKGFDNKTGYGLFKIPEMGLKMFTDYTEWKQAVYYLASQGQMDSPDYWINRIIRDYDVNLMWFCVKWANCLYKNSQ